MYSIPTGGQAFIATHIIIFLYNKWLLHTAMYCTLFICTSSAGLGKDSFPPLEVPRGQQL